MTKQDKQQHDVVDGVCKRCGVTASTIYELALACRGAITMTLEEAKQLNPDLNNLQVLTAEIEEGPND